MRLDGIRLTSRLRFALYTAFTLLFATGALWWISQMLEMPAEEFGISKSALLPWLMKTHGAVAMVALVLLGALYPVHIVRGWRARRNRSSGSSLVAGLCVLILSGYLLYYAGGEQTRLAASNVHLWLGLALPGIIFAHVWRGRVLRRRQEASLPK